eukprot:GHVQ01015635.1.p1 GENE.GHVQ01015635.1~~GHVQ01015635.1.p1  ORF type:complete len:722 (-),score=127.39 GHVQ01015635.1:2765-4930(-)
MTSTQRYPHILTAILDVSLVTSNNALSVPDCFRENQPNSHCTSLAAEPPSSTSPCDDDSLKCPLQGNFSHDGEQARAAFGVSRTVKASASTPSLHHVFEGLQIRHDSTKQQNQSIANNSCGEQSKRFTEVPLSSLQCVVCCCNRGLLANIPSEPINLLITKSTSAILSYEVRDQRSNTSYEASIPVSALEFRHSEFVECCFDLTAVNNTNSQLHLDDYTKRAGFIKVVVQYFNQVDVSNISPQVQQTREQMFRKLHAEALHKAVHHYSHSSPRNALLKSSPQGTSSSFKILPEATRTVPPQSAPPLHKSVSVARSVKPPVSVSEHQVPSSWPTRVDTVQGQHSEVTQQARSMSRCASTPNVSRAVDQPTQSLHGGKTCRHKVAKTPPAPTRATSAAPPGNAPKHYQPKSGGIGHKATTPAKGQHAPSDSAAHQKKLNHDRDEKKRREMTQQKIETLVGVISEPFKELVVTQAGQIGLLKEEKSVLGQEEKWRQMTKSLVEELQHKMGETETELDQHRKTFHAFRNYVLEDRKRQREREEQLQLSKELAQAEAKDLASASNDRTYDMVKLHKKIQELEDALHSAKGNDEENRELKARLLEQQMEYANAIDTFRSELDRLDAQADGSVSKAHNVSNDKCDGDMPENYRRKNQDKQDTFMEWMKEERGSQTLDSHVDEANTISALTVANRQLLHDLRQSENTIISQQRSCHELKTEIQSLRNQG